MSLWNDISDARLTAGRLWLPQLSLDYMGRDWESFTVPTDFEHTDVQIIAINGSAYQTLSAFHVCYPDDWDVDDTYITVLRLDCYFEFDWSVSAGAIPTVKVMIEDGDNEVTLTQATAWYNLYKTYTSSPPTGVTAEELQVEITGGETGRLVTINSTRSFGDRGPDSFYQMRVGT